MKSYKLSNLKRNPNVIKGMFKTVGNTTVVTGNVRVLFPTRYVEQKLVIMGDVVKTLSIFMIVDDRNNYALSLAPIMQDLTPSNINAVTLDGEPYVELEFNKGDVYIPDINLVMSDTFLYNIFDEFFTKGNVPSFLRYLDLVNIMRNTKKYANSNIDKNPLTFEVLISLISRDPGNKKIFFRMVSEKKPVPVYIGLSNIYYSFNNTGAKLIGGYFGDGLTTAIVEPEEKTSKVSKTLRK